MFFARIRVDFVGFRGKNENQRQEFTSMSRNVKQKVKAASYRYWRSSKGKLRGGNTQLSSHETLQFIIIITFHLVCFVPCTVLYVLFCSLILFSLKILQSTYIHTLYTHTYIYTYRHAYIHKNVVHTYIHNLYIYIHNIYTHI